MLSLFEPINFSQPYFLLVGLLPFLLIIVSQLFSTLSLNRYCDKSLQAWVLTKSKKTIFDKFYIGVIIPVLAWMLLSISLAGPRIIIDQRSTGNDVKFNNAIVFVLDVSKSMLAQDVYPDRITKAKLVIDKILSSSNNYLSSLIVYANNAHVAVPLTIDANVTLSILKSIRPNMLPIEGSNYSSGLLLAKKQLDSSPAANKLIVLLSDGDFVLSSKPSKTSINNILVNTIGLGSLEGQAIPNKDGSWLIFNNKPVISRLNKISLQKIAHLYNGKYFQIKSTIDYDLIKDILPTQQNNSSFSNQKTIIVWQQLFNWFLIPALLLFITSTLRLNKLSSNLKNNVSAEVDADIKDKLPQHANTSLKNIFILCTFLLASISYQTDSVASDIEFADTQYLNGNYFKAEKLYKGIEGYKGLIGQANSAYKQKNYTKALHLYVQSIKQAITDTNRAIALFNLANTYYTLGDYPQSISIYQDALLYNPYLKKARVNLEYAIIINEKVKRAIALRRGETKTAKAKKVKPGSGPRQADIEDGVDVGNSKVTLSNEESPNMQLYNFSISQKTINELIKRGIKHSIISSSEIAPVKENSQWNYEYTTLDMIDLLVKQERTDNFKLWKRLFEIEAGFPAPVESPRIQEGVKPW